MTVDGWAKLLGGPPTALDEATAQLLAWARFKGSAPDPRSQLQRLYEDRERVLRGLKQRPGPEHHKSLILWVGVGYRGLCRADGCAFIGPTRHRHGDALTDGRAHGVDVATRMSHQPSTTA